MSIRVHQLAKDLGITSKELMDKLHSLKIDVKGHMSALDDDTAFLVKEELKPKKTAKPKAKDKTDKAQEKPAPEKKKQSEAKVDAPVTLIINTPL